MRLLTLGESQLMLSILIGRREFLITDISLAAETTVWRKDNVAKQRDSGRRSL